MPAMAKCESLLSVHWTGGIPIEHDEYSRDGFAIDRTVREGFTDPNEDPCDECYGTGYEVPR